MLERLPLREGRHAYAYCKRDMVTVVAHHLLVFHLRAQGLGHGFGMGAAGLGQHHDELLATQTGHGVDV